MHVHSLISLYHVIFITAPNFECQDGYKLYATHNITNIGTEASSPIRKVTLLVCTPSNENLFCLQANDTEWQETSCTINQNKVKCPIYIYIL